MRLIPLTKGYFAKVDDEDYERLIQFKWHPLIDSKTPNLVYARRNLYTKDKKNLTILMHKDVFGDYPNRMDHIDRDGLNNQKANLRVATPVQNGMNMKLKNSAIPYKGVTTTNYGKFRSRISIDKKTRFLGVFGTAIEAAIAYDNAALLHYGEFATTNKQLGAL